MKRLMIGTLICTMILGLGQPVYAKKEGNGNDGCQIEFEIEPDKPKDECPPIDPGRIEPTGPVGKDAIQKEPIVEEVVPPVVEKEPIDIPDEPIVEEFTDEPQEVYIPAITEEDLVATGDLYSFSEKLIIAGACLVVMSLIIKGKKRGEK